MVLILCNFILKLNLDTVKSRKDHPQLDFKGSCFQTSWALDQDLMARVYGIWSKTKLINKLTIFPANDFACSTQRHSFSLIKLRSLSHFVTALLFCAFELLK